ncbi:hypothetical protein ACSFBX_26330 [Variovorax sp. RB2P76]|uniref:hypothetical protein n=1 Tax=Variovorax sp. RB2P76 TaxID=3443736 RepID=UPI003F475856
MPAAAARMLRREASVDVFLKVYCMLPVWLELLGSERGIAFAAEGVLWANGRGKS